MKTKYFLFCILLSLAVPCVLLAQAQQHEVGWGDIRLGPFFAGGGTVNAGDIANGTKTSPLPSFAGGAIADIPFTQRLALDLAVGCDNRAINFHDQANSDIGVDYNFGYVALRPTIRFGGLTLGMGVGVPVYAGTTPTGGALKPEVSASDMNVLYEGRIGGQVPLWDSKLGSLYLTLEGSYVFNRVLADSYYNGGDHSKNNGPLASSHVGVIYLFNIMEKNEEPALATSR